MFAQEEQSFESPASTSWREQKKRGVVNDFYWTVYNSFKQILSYFGVTEKLQHQWGSTNFGYLAGFLKTLPEPNRPY